MKSIEFERIVRDVGGIAAAAGVPAAALATEIAALLVRLGCHVAGCDDAPAVPPAPLPDEAAEGREAYADLVRMSNGLPPRSGS